MGRTLFEGFAGGSDPAILFVLASFYSISELEIKRNRTTAGVASLLGYIITTTLAGGLVMFTALNGSSAGLAQILFGISNGHLVNGMNLGHITSRRESTGEDFQVVTPLSSLCRCSCL